MEVKKTMEKIVALAKNRGFIYPGSEYTAVWQIHGITDLLEWSLKNNIKKAWWKKFVQENPYNVGVDCAILMNPQVWVASGHVGVSADP